MTAWLYVTVYDTNITNPNPTPNPKPIKHKKGVCDLPTPVGLENIIIIVEDWTYVNLVFVERA